MDKSLLFFENYIGKNGYMLVNLAKESDTEEKIYIVSRDIYNYFFRDNLTKDKIDLCKTTNSILMDLAFEKPLVFCNKYGLPVSSALISDEHNGKVIINGIEFEKGIKGYEVPREGISDHDNISLNEYQRIRLFAKNFFTVYSSCINCGDRIIRNKNNEEKLSEYNNLFSAIYNLLLFGYIRLGMCSLDSVNFQSDSYILQNKLQEYLESYTEKYAENSSFARWLSNTKTIVKSKEMIKLIDVLIFFLESTNIYGEFIIDLQELYIMPKITIGSYTTTINNGNIDNLLSVLIGCGSKLCFQIVEDFVNFFRIRIDFNEEAKKYYVKLEANNLFIASIVELYYLITSGREIRKCAAEYCGVFFFPTRPNKYYCCQDCKRKSEMKRRRDRKANESSNKCDSSTTTPSHHDTAENN